MKALDKLSTLKRIEKRTEEFLGISLDYPVEIISDTWSSSEDSIHWGYEDVKDEDSYQYSEEAAFVKEFSDCKMFKVFSCTGDKYLAILLKDKECKTI